MISPMSTPGLHVRRATVDDLARLLSLWKQENLPCADLEARFKEFQVVENETGGIAGAIGLQVSGHEGRLHSEAFEDFGQADALRAALWERVRTVAQNHGLVRVWSQFTSPYWRTIGLDHAPNELLTKLPHNFGADRTPWLCVKLRDDVPVAVSLDKEFALFRESEKEQTDKIMRQARLLKVVAGVVVTLVFVLVIVWAIMFFKFQKHLPSASP
jgi:N-acetylglutamate synthase-like GNAT family acetyltransferase